MQRTMPLALRQELIGLGGVVERNWYLVKRYIWWELTFFFWTVANTMTIVFIAKGVEATGVKVNVNELTTVLLIACFEARAFTLTSLNFCHPAALSSLKPGSLWWAHRCYPRDASPS